MAARRGGSIRNLTMLTIVNATKTTNATSCVTTNGGSVWVGALLEADVRGELFFEEERGA